TVHDPLCWIASWYVAIRRLSGSSTSMACRWCRSVTVDAAKRDSCDADSVRSAFVQDGIEAAGSSCVASHLVGLVAQYGYALIALFLFGEGLAIPFPTDTTLVTASALAARGHLSLVLVFLVATLSTAAGTPAAFYLGRSGS